jgi:hypothetical protein
VPTVGDLSERVDPAVETARLAGEDVWIAEGVGEQRASFIRSHQAYGEVVGVAPTRCLEAQTGVVAAPVPSILPTPAKLLEFGDCVRFAGARREFEVKHLDARAERLDAARDRPRDANGGRAGFRRGPDALRTGYPAGRGPAAVLRRCVTRMNVSPDSVRVNGVVLGFLLRSGSAWGR